MLPDTEEQLSGRGLDSLGGTIENPLSAYGGVAQEGAGLILLFTNLLRLVFVAAGIFALVNFIIAGFAYMTAGGDPKKLEQAWSRIWLTLLGLILVVGSFVFAALIGQLFFGDAGYILNPTITTPD